MSWNYALTLPEAKRANLRFSSEAAWPHGVPGSLGE